MSSFTMRLVAPFFALAVGVAAAGCQAAPTSQPATTNPAQESAVWSEGWSASPQRPSEGFEPNWSEQGFANHTVREVTRVTTGGSAVRIHLSNRYGASPLRVSDATIAATGDTASVLPGSLRQLTFAHAPSVVIPPGQEVTSDPVELRVDPLQSLSTSLYFEGPTGPATFHSQAYSTSYRSTGNHVDDQAGTAFDQSTHSWYFLQDVEVSGGQQTGAAVVAFGDSITDGFGSGNDRNDRWPDQLAERLAASGTPRSVLNEGIGGNMLLNDSAWYGDTATRRFARDVLDKPRVGTAIVLLGTNDLGYSETDKPTYKPAADIPVEDLIAGHRDLIAQAHARGVKIIGATVLPFGESDHYSERSEAKRTAVNDWIRTSGEYDAVVDFDRALADPADPRRLNPAYDSGDHLHPNGAGYDLMAAVVDLGDI